MVDFKVGDKIVAKKNAPYTITTDGWRGTVTKISHLGEIWVAGNGIAGYSGTPVDPKYFYLDTSNQKIIITTDGKTTTAKKYDGKTVVKTAVAKCSPDDKFDFDTGAKIAVDRLFDIIEEKALLNTKICIVNGDDTFKTGHIYEIIDGKIENSDTLCMLFPIIGRFHSVKDVKDYFSPKRLRKTGETWSGKTIEFVEVVE